MYFSALALTLEAMNNAADVYYSASQIVDLETSSGKVSLHPAHYLLSVETGWMNFHCEKLKPPMMAHPIE